MAGPFAALSAPWVLGLGALLLPIGFSAAGAAQPAKPAFVAAVVGVALLLVRRRPDAYVAFVLWLFILTPGLRHYVDWHAGYSQTNPMMLAPYCAALVSLPTAALYLLFIGLCVGGWRAWRAEREPVRA